MVSLEWKRPHHSRWLAACLTGLVLAALAGGFNLGLAAVFVIVFAVGAAVLSLDGLGAPRIVDPEPEPADEVTPSDDPAPA